VLVRQNENDEYMGQVLIVRGKQVRGENTVFGMIDEVSVYIRQCATPCISMFQTLLIAVQILL
jgi:hypothetical protein